MTEPRAVLAALAHPDDEVFSSGGMLAGYAADEVQATLVCATRGEAGEISDPALATPETLGAVREAELRCACQALGINEPIFLDYRDSGMADTADNGRPEAFCNIPAEEVVPRLVGLIRRLRPQVVVTFDPNGGYGHPDHIAIHRHTVAAFHAAGDAARFPDRGPVWQPNRLFYTVIPESAIQDMAQRLEAAGVDTSQFERFRERRIFWPEEKINVRLDVSAWVEAKRAALTCHRTQIGPDHPLHQVPETESKQIMRREHFALAWPEPTPGLHLPDLFSGL